MKVWGQTLAVYRTVTRIVAVVSILVGIGFLVAGQAAGLPMYLHSAGAVAILLGVVLWFAKPRPPDANREDKN
jgi:heme A synthase